MVTRSSQVLDLLHWQVFTWSKAAFEPTDKIDDFKMGLCISVEREDFEDVVRYDGGTLLCFKHGEGTNLYENGDTYKGQWKWNKMHGHGVYTHANGEV